MIYIKNTKEIQTIFIPRTELEKDSYVVSVKSYDEGYADGIVEGKKLQKLKLTNLTVSENGVYKREDGWNEVEVDVPDIPSKTQQKTLYVTKNTDVVLPDEGYDALTKVVVNATQYGQDKRNEGYQSGYDKGKLDAGNEGYNKGYNKGYDDGIATQKGKLTNLSVTTNGTYNREDGWNKVVVSVPSTTFKTQQKNITLTKDIETVTPSTGYDGLTKVGIDATFYVKTKRDEGYAEGHLQGKTEGIEEGYNQGYADGKAEGGAINLVELDETPKFGDGENDIIEYKPSNYNADGFSNVKINVTSVYHSGYTNGNTEGYNQGKTDGIYEQKSKLESISITENGTYTKEDGYNKITINVPDVNGSYDEGYNEGYNEGYAEGKGSSAGIINVGEVGIKFGRSTFAELPSYYDFKDVVNLNDMFYGCEYLRTIPEMSTSKVTTMESTFELCKNLTSIPYLDTSNVNYMLDTFSNCEKLTTIPELNTSMVQSMNGLFMGCASLTSIPYLITSRVKDMQYMFYGCFNLTSVPNLTTDNVLYMDSMFSFCESLTTIPELNTSMVQSMNYLMSGCINLVSVPPLNAEKVTEIEHFFGSSELTKLTDFGGLIGLKASMTDNYGFVKTPNLSYQSCINILNGLFDFKGNGKNPNVFQGKLKVHQNFLDLVGDKISIATSKGWTITA